MKLAQVTLPEMRAEVISAVRALADPEYQQRVWIDRIYPKPNFFDDFTLNVNILNDATVLEAPEAALGYTLASDAEVRAMSALANALDSALNTVGRDASDAEFMASEPWPGVVAAARDALTALTE
ncbi:SCO4402 family protein [Streptomyces sp. NPDC055897]